MKTLILLAITGGLFFTSPGLDTKHAKSNKACAKNYVKHCVKKSCNHAKKAKLG
ncbi:hypothetical protein [Mucilaginibacter sp. OK268]|jgi:hypothetical protein|uniref:hypothetical protein n=1 Tax=Mucilaginibacter sp. OK268 TaxID=1881048 RepID=UPI0015A28D8D|nr:hypothetical protein [Mucilaginibacter sp. OK268]